MTTMHSLAACVLGTCLLLTHPVPTQSQFATSLDKQHLPETLLRTAAMAAGDIDGDGDVDLVTGVAPGAPLRILLNTGGGVFEDATTGRFPTIPAYARQALEIFMADLDKDGDLDLVTRWPSGAHCLFNDGRGFFGKKPIVIVTAFGGNVAAVGDLDGNGSPDILLENVTMVGTSWSAYFVPYLNNGKGGFSASGRIGQRTGSVHSVTASLAVTLADVDGHRGLDVIYTLQSGLHVAKSGSGHSVTSGPGLGARFAHRLKAGDLDGDGDLDLFVGCGKRLGFTRSQDTALLNNGKGAFTEVSATAMPVDEENTHGLVLFDADGDGDLDAALASSLESSLVKEATRLYLNDGKAKFSRAGSGAVPGDPIDCRTLVASDVDGDRDIDLLVPGYGTIECDVGQRDRLYLNDGKGVFIDATAGTTFGVVNRPCVADVNGDGLPDIFTGNSAVKLFGPGRVPTQVEWSLYLNRGPGRFQDVTLTHLPKPIGAPYKFAVVLTPAFGDLDNDGDQDIVFMEEVVSTSGTTSRQTAVLLNDGQGRFARAAKSSIVQVPYRLNDLVLVDVDSDRDLDIFVVGGFYTSEVQPMLLENDGKGRFTDGTARRLPKLLAAAGGVACADLEGDGDVDLWFMQLKYSSGYTSTAEAFINDGKGNFTIRQLLATPGIAGSLEVGDVDADGDVDLFIVHNSHVRSYRNDGKGTFSGSPSTVFTSPPNFSTGALITADIDRDGDLDLAVTNGSSFCKLTDLVRTQILLNDGKGSFRNASATRASSVLGSASRLLFSDLDVDGDPDLIMTSGFGGTIAWNLHRQVLTPLVPRLGQPFRIDFYVEPGYATTDHSVILAASPGVLARPIQVPGLGPFFLRPPFAVAPAFQIPKSAGSRSLSYIIPKNTALIGQLFNVQAVVYESAGGKNASLTNHRTDRITR